MKAITPDRERLKQADWVVLGIEQLTSRGPTAMTLEALCQAAGRTKGSFYAHFDDMNAFVSAVVSRWRQTQTEDLVAALPENPEAALVQLDALAQQLNWDLEHAIRLWAHSNLHVLVEVRAVDQRRIEVLTQLHRALGATPGQATTNAMLSYASLLGILTMSASWPELRASAADLGAALHAALCPEHGHV